MLAPDERSTTSFGYRLCEYDGRLCDAIVDASTSSSSGSARRFSGSSVVPIAFSAGQENRSASVCGANGLKSMMKMRSLERVK